ncbi:SDR family NAD(P)-dependent oxidoreductase [Marilutibacter chinensis]|uniref:Glucose 1-dehydrogenase n=1 Tax=Marilutibacter chinensis TaxID=2912247 RepID=A0ABS9HRF4_9GAMM|nr:glucose 1-dehydrogenase [Lysobacter chinensis]MCF7221511.1 glucose 1-dehydrogenase [Lysobacter chinensis]
MTGITRRELLGASLAATATATATATALATGLAPARAADPQRSGRGRLAGKVAIITGATSGIGRATAFAFAREGARVGFCGRREVLGREVEAEIRADGGEALFVRADVTVPDQVREFVDAVVRRYGGLHVAFNNAGITGRFRPLHELGLEEWDAINATNTRGVFVSMKQQIPHMLRSGGGSIILTSSLHERSTRPGAGAYATSKRALMGLAQATALDYGAGGIRVNVIAPGIIDTPLFRGATGASPEMAEQSRQKIDAFKRIGTPEEIADVALWLASDESRYMTGSSVLADGGVLAGL